MRSLEKIRKARIVNKKDEDIIISFRWLFFVGLDVFDFIKLGIGAVSNEALTVHV